MVNTYEGPQGRDRMRTYSKHPDHLRLGLSIVLAWPRHGADYISNYHQHQYLTKPECDIVHTDIQISPSPLNRVSRGNASAPLFLSYPSANSSSGTYCKVQSVYVLQEEGVIGENPENPTLFPAEHRVTCCCLALPPPMHFRPRR